MLANILEINKGDIISFTGSSGKTTLMFAISEELRAERILVTTTTKIYLPKTGLFDNMHIGDLKALTVAEAPFGVTVAGKYVTEDNKLSGYRSWELLGISEHFDYALVESDGSKQKPLKAWGELEPVVPSNASITIGIISVCLVGSEISSVNTHRSGTFAKNFMDEKKTLSIEHIAKAITHEEGLFKNSAGKRILFINKVETESDKKNVHILAEMVSSHKDNFISKIVYGSVKNGIIRII